MSVRCSNCKGLVDKRVTTVGKTTEETWVHTARNPADATVLCSRELLPKGSAPGLKATPIEESEFEG